MTLKMSGNERTEKMTMGRGRSHSSSARGQSAPAAATGMRSCKCTRACASPPRTWLSRTLTMLAMMGFLVRACGSPLLVLAVPLWMWQSRCTGGAMQIWYRSHAATSLVFWRVFRRSALLSCAAGLRLEVV
jgi:hypothetical protein